MRIAIVTLLVIAAVSGYYLSQTSVSQEAQTIQAAAVLSNVSEAAPAKIAANPEVPPAPKMPDDLKRTAQQLENEIADLRHEIDQGRYLDRINDDGTAPFIKEELRGRLRLMVKKTITLTQVNLRRLDEGQSI